MMSTKRRVLLAAQRLGTAAVLGGSALLASCALLGDVPAPTLHTYAMAIESMAVPAPESSNQKVLMVDMPRAAPGCDSTHMMYVRHAMQKESYVNSAWIDTPAHMLAPLPQSRLTQAGIFRAVVLEPSSAKADFRLDTTVTRLEQDFLLDPGTVRLTLELTLIDNATRQVLAVRTVDVRERTRTNNAEGGAWAVNTALARALAQVVTFLDSARLQ